ncbi:ROK family transcriptional regulator [Sporolactobacillus sp. THM7-7]|nr:ROK family transcriptional regulator [Sporolactobacillus sp. THM7-7]
MRQKRGLDLRKGNVDLIRKINGQLVLDVIRRDQPVSRAGIARKLSLSRSTVSMIVNELMEKNIVIEQGTGQSTIHGGRRGTLLGFNPKAAYGMGVDLQEGHSRAVLADMDGEIVKKEIFSFDHDLMKLKDYLGRFIHEESNARHLMGIGFSVPSMVKDHEIVVDAPSLGWKNVNLAEELAAEIGLDVYVMNDVNAAAIGERELGQARETDHLFYLSMGTGVGSAIIANGEWVPGADQAAGEIGYLLERDAVDHDEPYTFGRFGSLERKLIALLKESARSSESRQELIVQLSVVFANVCYLLNPEKIIIGGAYESRLRPLIPEIQKKVRRFCPVAADISYSLLGEDAAVMGSVTGLYRFLQDLRIK